MAVTPRVVCWFSCGDASAVATVLALRKYGQTHETVVARIVIPSEHMDNERFSEDCQEWFGQPIIHLRSDMYADTWDVWESRKYIAGIAGAPCTAELKKAVRFKFQRPDDIHVFGYTAEESKRADTFKRNNFDLAVDFPCIEAGLHKPDDYETPAPQHKPGCHKEGARLDGADRWYMLECDCISESEGNSHVE